MLGQCAINVIQGILYGLGPGLCRCPIARNVEEILEQFKISIMSLYVEFKWYCVGMGNMMLLKRHTIDELFSK